jgi:chemotaxis protein methyltransferase CheR
MSQSNNDISLEELDELLTIINNQYGYDFREYSQASMLRRVKRFIDDTGFASTNEVIANITNNRKIFDFFLQRITVNVTEMFRDPGFYKVLKQKIIPVLATFPIIKIWHAGCSSGEEVFSNCILLHEAGLLDRCRIYATDINPNNIEKAKKGILSSEVMKEYVSNYLKAGGSEDFAQYYTAKYNHAIIRKDLREHVLFSQHNLVTDQVFNEFQLIFCRNVMIYFNRQLQNKVLRLFYDSLSNFGYLALGVKETLLFADVKSKFEDVDLTEKIYRKVR